MSAPINDPSRQLTASVLRKVALFTLGVFLVVVLGANSVAAAGGPLTWFPLLRLPTAGGEWTGIGPVMLLPVISVTAWAGYWLLGPRSLRPPWQWGWRRITWPALALWLWALIRTGAQCLDGPCPTGAILRLVLLAAVFFWAYLLISGQQPDLLWVIAPVIVLQSAAGISQFIMQRDLGLSFLGEPQLDPAVSGVAVILNGGERWLRAYGFTPHPNSLARLLVVCLMTLPILVRGAAGPRRWVALVVFGVGTLGLVTTLSRWGWACLIIGLGINALPTLVHMLRQRKLIHIPRGAILISSVILVTALLFLSRYGDAVYGRFFNLSSSLERGSLLVRSRDVGVSLQIVQGNPLTGVGPANYSTAAREFLPAIVHGPDLPLVPSVPLLVAAELGIVGVTLWLWLFVWPLWRRGAFTTWGAFSALWVVLFLLGLFYASPYPLYEMTSASLLALAAGLVASSGQRSPAAGIRH